MSTVGIRLLQQPDGSFKATYDGIECDSRFVYCACAISTFLNDWSAVDKDKATQYLLNCFTYEGGFALYPGNNKMLVLMLSLYFAFSIEFLKIFALY